jgi:hypothetical protein
LSCRHPLPLGEGWGEGRWPLTVHPGEQATRRHPPHVAPVDPKAQEKPIMAESLGWVWVLTLALLIYGSHLTRHRHALH